jgi:hypothetical protein
LMCGLGHRLSCGFLSQYETHPTIGKMRGTTGRRKEARGKADRASVKKYVGFDCPAKRLSEFLVHEAGIVTGSDLAKLQDVSLV